MTTARRIALPLLYALPLVFLAVFFLYPLARILQVSFYADGRWMLDSVGRLTGSRYFWRLIWFTTWQAVASTALTLTVGLPLAYLFARYDFRGKSVVRALTTIPFVMPTVVVAAAFTALLGRTGLINVLLQQLLDLEQPPIALLGTIWIILLAHAFFNVSVIIRAVGGFWSNLNPSLEEAAAVLGANRARLFWEVTLPLLWPSIAAASLLVFLFCFTSFGVVLILGGARFATLEVEIYRQAVSLFDLPAAAWLSLVQMILTFIMMTLYTRLQARTSLPLESRSQARTAVTLRTPMARLFLALTLGMALLLLLAPLITLAWRSITLGDNGVTLAYYRALADNPRQSAFFVPPIVAVGNSLLFAAATTLLSLLLGIISAYLLARPRTRRTAWLEPIFLLPLGTSAVTLGLGYILAMGPWRTALWLTPVAHTLIAAPFVVRTFLPALRSLDPRLRESAAVLGAPPLRTWLEVDVPILFRAALVAATFAFTISLGEFGASLLVTRPDTPTMPVIIYRALSRPGQLNYGQALAMSTVLMIVAGLSLILIERFRIGDIGEF
ncbi:MAG: iron ABC transporter permease [Caldilineaceae bacterium]|nr:iron ABC transporter permease [Caldilineaceae bacterium]